MIESFKFTHKTSWLKLVVFFCLVALCGQAIAQRTQSQSIQFLPISDRAVNSAPFQVVAVSSAYLPVTLQVTGPATLNGRLLTLTGVGTVTVTASQAGNADYAPVTGSLSFQSLAVTPSLGLSPVTVPYGSPASSYAFNASATASPYVDPTADVTTVTTQFDTSVLSPGNAATYPQTASVFRYEGADVGPSTQVNDGAGYNVYTAPPQDGLAFRIAFTCDCQQFEFEIQARQASYRLWVDGAYTSVESTPDIDVYPRRLFVLVSFPDKRMRQIKIVDGGNAPFYGVYTANGDTLSAPQVPLGPAVMIFGDSWTGPTIVEPLSGPTQPGLTGSGYPQTLGEFFNWDYWDNGVGGSGFTTVGTDPLGRTFVQRIEQELCPYAFQNVFILGGVNDSTNETAEQAAVSQAISEIQTCEEGSPIYLYGPQYGAQAQIDTAMAAAAAGVTGTFSYKDIKEANWIYGVNTDSSTGNAYLYINAHPTPLGHDFLAEMFAMDLVHNFPNLMPSPYTLMAPAPLAGAYSISQIPAMPSVGSYPVTVTFTPSDASHFAETTTATTLTVSQATTTTNETVSLANGTATLTATVAPQIAGVPTGTVTFVDQSSGQTLATEPLSNGVATTQIALNTLTQGTHSVNANYSGDSNFLPSSMQTPVTFIASTPDFSFTFGQTQLTLPPGSSGTLPLTIIPLGGLTGPLSVQCSGLPQNSSCSLTGTPTLAAGVLTATLTVQAFTPSAHLAPLNIGSHPESRWWSAAGGAAFCCLLGVGPLWRRRRILAKIAAIVALCVLAGGGAGMLSGCGSTSAIQYATPGSYAVQVALTANAGTSTAVTHTQSITVNLP